MWRLHNLLLVVALLIGVGAYLVQTGKIPGLTNDSKAARTTPAAQNPLADREKSLASLESELKARESQLIAKEAQVADRLKELGAQKAQLDTVQKLAGMYAEMAPYKAAPLMQALDVQTTVQIIRQMDRDQASAVISYMESARAAQVMSQLANSLIPAAP